MTQVIILLIVVLALWVSPVLWAWKINHPYKKIITVLAIFFGPITFLASLITLSHRETPLPTIGDPGVFQCENCDTPYRLSDYLEEVEIYCGNCKSPLGRNQDVVA